MSGKSIIICIDHTLLTKVLHPMKYLKQNLKIRQSSVSLKSDLEHLKSIFEIYYK